MRITNFVSCMQVHVFNNSLTPRWQTLSPPPYKTKIRLKNNSLQELSSLTDEDDSSQYQADDKISILFFPDIEVQSECSWEFVLMCQRGRWWVTHSYCEHKDSHNWTLFWYVWLLIQAMLVLRCVLWQGLPSWKNKGSLNLTLPGTLLTEVFE